jgi:DNA-binding NarL/FixJ family response regulator
MRAMPAPAFVGRVRELAILREQLSAAISSGEERMVVVAGPGGVGKTRLLSELRSATRRRVRWLVARGSPSLSAVPLGLFRQALGPSPVRGTATGVDLAWTLTALALERPTAVWLDDVHQADPATWAALNHLGRNPVPAPLLLLAALRPEALARAGELSVALGSLLKDGQASEVRLAELGEAEVWRLAEHVLGPARVSADLARWLTDRTRGNPLLLVSVLEDLAADTARRSVAGTVRERVRHLMSALSEGARQAAEVAAVIGADFSARAVLAMEPGAAPGLDELVAAEVLVEDSRTGRLDFAHPILQEALYASVGPGRRAQLHRLVAELMPAPPEVRAFHLARGAAPGDRRAVGALRTAAREAMAAKAPSVGVARLHEALNLAPPSDPVLRAELLDELAGAADAAGDHTSGIPALRELLTLVDDPGQVAGTRLRLSSFLSAGAGDLAEAEQQVNEAIALSRRHAPDRLPAALNELGWIRGEAGSLVDQVRHCGESRSLAREREDQVLELHSLGPMAHALALMGRAGEAMPLAARAARIASGLGDQAQSDWHASVRGEVLEAAGRLEEGVAAAEPLVGSGRETADVVHSNLVRQLWHLGRWDSALEAARRLLAVSPPAVPVRTAWALALGAALEVAMERAAAARPLLALADRRYGGRSFYCFSAWHDWAAGMAEWFLGDPERGLRRVRRSVDWLQRMGALAALSLELPDLCQLEAVAGSFDAARAACRRAEEVAARLETPTAGAASAFCHALVATDEDGLVAAAAVADAAGLRYLAARALEARGEKWLAEAARRYAALPAPVLEGACLARLRGSGDQGRRAARSAGRLTARESEVAALARRGLPSAAIASRLHISERTVESHLAHIYSKLGIGGRRELRNLGEPTP